MKHRLRRRLRWAVVGAIAVAGLAAARISYASIPDASGVIHGCYDTSSGALRAIDTAQNQTCTKHEAPLDWNQTGPQGPQGVQGPPGPQGDQGPAGPGVLAVASVSATGTVNSALTRGLTQANVTHPATGVYCIGGLSPDPLAAVANGKRGLANDGNGGFMYINTDTIITVGVMAASPVNFLAGCQPGDQVEVLVYSAAQAQLVDRGFNVSIEN